MSETAEIWNLSALCRCCHSDGYFKSLQEGYIYDNEIEIYANMLRSALNIEINPPMIDASYTICDMCIVRLRDAYQFKVQVINCEKKFEEYCRNELSNGSIKAEVDSNFDDDHGTDDGPIFEIPIKSDQNSEVYMKKEENDFKPANFIDIKIEDDSKMDIKLKIPSLGDVNLKSEQKKKRVTKTTNTGPSLRKLYDPSLEVQVVTENGVLYSCKLCGGSYPNQKLLKRHIQTTHQSYIYKCMYCEETFHTAKLRNAHLKTHEEYATKCRFCEKIFHTKQSLHDHEKTHTKSKVFQCDLCSKDFAYKSTLRMHLKGHYGTKTQCICHLCGHGFNDRANLNAHIATVHEKQRPFACELCPKTFTANKHLKVHLRMHTGERPYACEICPKRYYSQGSLNTHKLSHLDKANRFTCKVCRKIFSDKTHFLRHIRKMHVGQRPFKCDICGKDFTCKYSMKRHIFEHNGLKPHECEHCGVKFAQKGALKRHVNRKHVMPKAIMIEKCEICNKNVKDLKKHMDCHNNKRYHCEFCDKSYSENNVLTRHKKEVHFGMKPHVCEFCDKKYLKVNSLRNHQLKVHKIVSKIETDEDFGDVAKFSIKNRKGKIKTEGMVDDMPSYT